MTGDVHAGCPVHLHLHLPLPLQRALMLTVVPFPWFGLLQSFESWMHKWLLFEMAKNPQTEEPTKMPAVKGSGLTDHQIA